MNTLCTIVLLLLQSKKATRALPHEPLLLKTKFLTVLREYFEPVSVGVGDEIESHLKILVTDAAHLFVELVSRFVILDAECKVELALSEIVRLRVIGEPR